MFLFLAVGLFGAWSQAADLESEPPPPMVDADSQSVAVSEPSQGVVGRVGRGRLIRPEILGLRDPFQPPAVALALLEKKTELEQYSLSDFKLLGVITGPDHIKALLQTSDGSAHFVVEKMKIGQKNGVITKIFPHFIRIREKFMNEVGEEEVKVQEIHLPTGVHVKGTGTL